MKADPVAVAAVLGGLNQPFDLCLGQVLRVCRSLLGAAACPAGSASLVRCNLRAPLRAVRVAQPWSASASAWWSLSLHGPPN